MTPHPPTPRLDHRSERTHRRITVAAFAALGLFAAIGIGVSVAAQPDTRSAAAPTPTGEINAMGMPVVATPGESNGSASAGPVEVTGGQWELGTVPLDVAVRPYWVLRNTGTEPVVVGEPHPEVREGCCPGAFTLDATTIEPGGIAELTFELSMHTGMDGWHDIAVHVPVADASGEHVLALGVTGNFTNT